MNKKFLKDCLLIILFCILLCIGLVRIDDVLGFIGGLIKLLEPLFVGLLVALLLNIPYNFFYRKFSLIKVPLFLKIAQRRGKSPSEEKNKRKGGAFAKGVALLLTYLIFFAAAVLLVSFVVPQVSSSVQEIAGHAEQYLQQFFAYIEELKDRFFEGESIFPFIDIDLDRLSQLINDLLAELMDYAEGITSGIINLTSGIVSGALNFVLGLVFSVYFLLGKDKIKAGCKRFFDAFVPAKVNRSLEKGVHLVNGVLSSYLAKQVTEGLIVGLISFTVMSITGFAYPVLGAVVLGLFCMVPVFGPVLGVGISVFLILLISPSGAIFYLIFFILIIIVTYKLFMPKLYKVEFSLHPLLVLFSVAAGGYAFGFWGIFFAVPCMTVLSVLVNEYVLRKENSSDLKQVTTVADSGENKPE